MNYDLYLTNTGDISFLMMDTKNVDEKLEFVFYVAPSESLLFNFNIINKNYEEIIPNSLTFTFNSYENPYRYNTKIVTDYTYMKQAIKLRIETELGTVVQNESLGSDVFNFMHSNMSNNRLETDIKRAIEKAIFDILPNATVEVYFLNTDYLNYHDSIRIVITNNEEIYYYII